MEDLQARLNAAVAAGNFDGLGRQLDEAEINYPDAFLLPEWPHAIHILAHIHDGNLEDARFVYKRTPPELKPSPDTAAAFSLLQRLWCREYTDVWAAMSYQWPPNAAGLAAAVRSRLVDRAIDLVSRAYTSISLGKLAALTGCNVAEARALAESHRWTVVEADMVEPVRHELPTVQPNEGDLVRIAQYVVYCQTGHDMMAIDSNGGAGGSGAEGGGNAVATNG